MSRERSIISRSADAKAMAGKRGFSIIEGVVVIAILAVSVVVVVGEIIYSQQVSARSFATARATNLATEAIEAVKDIRNANFFDLTDGVHGLKLSQGRWALASGTPETIDGTYNREILISSPLSNQKRVEVTVSWLENNEVKLLTEFRNWFATVEDWSNPQYDGDFDLTPENSGSNNHKIRAIKVKGNHFFVGNDNSAGKEFLIFSLIDSPAVSIKGTLDLDGDPQDISIFGNYAFIASGSQSEELQVIDFTDFVNPVLVKTFNLTGNSDVLSSDIDSSGDILVMGREDGSLYVFNISIPDNPVLIGQLSLAGNPDLNDLKILEDNVFIASEDGSLRVVSIASPSFPAQIASINLTGCEGALSLDVTENRAYVGCEGSNNDNELFIIDIINPASLLLLSSVDIGNQLVNIEHISFATTFNLIFLLTGDTAKDLQVWDVSNDLMPALFSFVDLDGSPTQADYSPLAQKMFVGLTSNPEIQIVAPSLIEEPLP